MSLATIESEQIRQNERMDKLTEILSGISTTQATLSITLANTVKIVDKLQLEHEDNRGKITKLEMVMAGAKGNWQAIGVFGILIFNIGMLYFTYNHK